MKYPIVIEGGTELRIPTGKMEGWTLTALDGPAVTITVNGAPLSVGDTVGAGEVVITRAQDGSSNDTWVEFDDGEAGGEPGPAGPKGDTGATGPTGATGRGIATITVSGGHLTGTYSDGTPWDAGALPAGSGGGLDAEAVQDILGAMLGEAQGHYDDAAGTYTINLPAGGTVTDEQVQDIVAALVKAGTNVTVNYDDAAGTLTIAAAGGSGGGTGDTPHLSAPAATVQRLPRPTQSAGVAPGVYRQFTPTANTTLTGLSDTTPHSTTVRAAIWNANTQAQVALSPVVTAPGTAQPYSLLFSTPVELTAGVPYMIGMYSESGQLRASDLIENLAYAGFTVDHQTHYDPYRSNYPNSTIATVDKWGPTFDLLQAATASKGVIGPLDPADFPVVTGVGEIPNGGGARLRGTNNFYLRRETGQLLEFIGTPVSG